MLNLKYKFKVKTYAGESHVEYDTECLGPLEEKCLAMFDWRVADLVNLFVEQEFCNSDEGGIRTEAELLLYEVSCNSVNGEIIKTCHGISESGIQISVDEIKERCSYIWKSYLFVESTGMDFMDIQFYWKLRDNITDPDELLFWTFRLCAWGEYENPFPYTLYKGLIDGRFRKFYDNYKNERESFVSAEGN